MLQNIPQELKDLRRWFLCNKDKTPTLNTGWQLQANLSTFNNLDQSAIAKGFLPAFVLLKGDGYLFVDFDKTASLTPGSKEHSFHLSCLKNTETYAEYSMSGDGFHLMYHLPGGWAENRKNRTTWLNLECYSQDRYAILTGNRANNNNIVYSLHEIAVLEEAAALRDSGLEGASTTCLATESDEAIGAKMVAGDNDRLLANFNRQYAAGLPEDFDSSEFDLAFCNRAATYTGDPEQIERLWLSHPCSLRDWKPDNHPNRHKTTQRPAYRKLTISKALNNPKSFANMQQFKAALQLKPFSPPPEEGRLAIDPRIDMPPGLMSTLYDYYNSAALHTFPEAAIFFVLTYMSRYVNSTYEMPPEWRFGSKYSPLGGFFLLIAGTSRGKSFPMDIIARLDHITDKIELELPEATVRSKLELEEQGLPYAFNKVSKFFRFNGKPPSGAGVRKSLDAGHGRANFNIGEFEGFWDDLTNPRKPSSEDLKAHILTGFDGTAKHKVNYSDSERDLEEIEEVFMSIYGEATPNIYLKINPSDMRSGLLNRFIIFDYAGSVSPPNFDGGDLALLEVFQEQVVPLLTCVADVALTRHKIAVKMDPAVTALFKRKYTEAIEKMNAESDDEIRAALEARDFRKAQRLAVYAAVSRDPTEPVVSAQDLEWAMGVTSRATEKISQKFHDGAVGSEALYGRTRFLMNSLRGFLSTRTLKSKREVVKRQKGIVTRKEINRLCKKSPAFNSTAFRDSDEIIDKTLKSLMENGVIVKAIGSTDVIKGAWAIKAEHYYVDMEMLLDAV